MSVNLPRVSMSALRMYTLEMRWQMRYSAATASPRSTVESIFFRIARDSFISEKKASLSSTGSSITWGSKGFP